MTSQQDALERVEESNGGDGGGDRLETDYLLGRSRLSTACGLTALKGVVRVLEQVLSLDDEFATNFNSPPRRIVRRLELLPS